LFRANKGKRRNSLNLGKSQGPKKDGPGKWGIFSAIFSLFRLTRKNGFLSEE
jgi:hypothetical protein